MPLDKINLPISFAQGVDTKTDALQVVPGRFLALENAVMTSPRSFRKRYGYLKLGTTLTSAGLLSTFQNELVVDGSSTFLSLSSATSTFISKGSYRRLELSSKPVVRNAYSQTVPDCAYHSSGIEVYTWTDGRGTVRYSVIDSATGHAIINDTSLSANSALAKPIAVGQYVYIFYRNTSSNNLVYRYIAALSPTVLSAEVTVSSTFNATNTLYDVCLLNDRAYVVYNNNSAGGISFQYIDRYLTISAKVDLNANAASSVISCFADATRGELYVAYGTGTTLRYCVRALDLTAVLAATSVEVIAAAPRNVTGYASNGSGRLWWEVTAASAINAYVRSATITRGGTVASIADFLRSVGLLGKAFLYGSDAFVPVTHASTIQPTHFLLDVSAKVVAKWAPSNAGGLTASSLLSEVVFKSTSVAMTASLKKDLFTTVSGSVFTSTGVESFELNLSPSSAPQKAEMGVNLHVGGGVLHSYDGAVLAEHNFHLYPEIVTGTAGSAGSMGTGSYQVAVCYEWSDNQGQIHRSPMSVVGTYAVTGPTGSIALTISSLRITAKPATVTVVVYRTEANGSVFYRESSVASPTFNTTTTDTVSFTCTVADATLIGNPLLYTTGGILENFPAPATTLLAKFRNRVVAIPSEGRLSYLLSKKVVPGSPLEFTAELEFPVQAAGGKITAVAEMDGKLVFFKRQHIMATVGQGPDDSGLNNDMQEPDVVSTDGGCVDPNSVVLMPDGLMYKSEKGIYLLTRSLSVAYIGAAVEAYNSYSVRSATLVPGTTQVRFLLSSGDALVYDYGYKGEDGMGQWGVFTDHLAKDATVFQEQYTYLREDGRVFQESSNLFTDDGAFVRLKAITSWLSLAGLQGFQRVYRLLLLGQYKSAHQLNIQAAYDFNPSATQDELIDASTLLNPTAYGADTPYGSGSVFGGEYPTYEFRLDFTRQKCSSIQLTFQDAQDSNYGEGMSLSSFTLVAGKKKGPNRLKATRTFG